MGRREDVLRRGKFMKKRHALFVGVDQYADQNIQGLHCAVNDATELAGFFKHRAGFDRAEALANPSNSEVVLERVRDMLDGLGGGDEFLFFFAGHGIKTLDGHRLVCADDQLSEVQHSWAGFPLERLKANTSGAFDRLFLLDACRTDVHATNRGAGGAMEKGSRDLILCSAGQTSAKGGELTIVCSCDDGECAGESLLLHHGLFTMAMLELLDEESRLGHRVRATDEFVYGRLPDRMRVLSEKSDMVFGQKPQKRGPAILILDGSEETSETPAEPASHMGGRVAAPVLVACPLCGKKNRAEETFRCLECGHENLCLRHQDVETFLCASCMAKRKQKAAAEAARKVRERAEEEQKARERAQAERTAGKTKRVDLGGGVVLEMVHCPRVAKEFWMGKTAVTQEQWERVMGKNPSYFKGRPKNPVETVSWYDCQKFVKKLNALAGARASGLAFRLPTEEEWETACRAGAPKRADYCMLADGTQITAETLGRVAWYGKLFAGSTHPVGHKEPNAWGLYDMLGNVFEWTETAGYAIRVCRGGSFGCPDVLCTAGSRGRFWPIIALGGLGLRLAGFGRPATD